MIYYVTIPQDGPGCYAIVGDFQDVERHVDKNGETSAKPARAFARERVVEKRGRKWCSVYDEPEWAQYLRMAGPQTEVEL